MVTSIGALAASETQANQASGTGVFSRITQAIKQASARTGVDFSYLLNKASQESGFDPNAKASSSTATGLFQFTQQTWLQMVKSHGGQYGLGSYADQITTDKYGVAHVSNPAMRQAILGLRKDPAVSAEMAGELDKQNYSSLQTNVGGKIGPTELYLAHFLGAGGASNFISAMRSNPGANAANVLPEAAAANPSVFYDKSGAPRSVGQIYRHFAQKFDSTPQQPGATMVADAGNVVASSYQQAVASLPAAKAGSYVPSVMSGVQASNNSSLYATMVIAQMGDMQNASMSLLGSVGEHKNGSAISALGSSVA